MNHSFDCPECGHEHSEPADARFVLAVLCSNCETAVAVDARADVRAARRRALARPAA